MRNDPRTDSSSQLPISSASTRYSVDPRDMAAPRPPWATALLVAVAVPIAVFFPSTIDPHVAHEHVFFPSVLAVIAVAWYSGFAGGIITCALCAVIISTYVLQPSGGAFYSTDHKFLWFIRLLSLGIPVCGLCEIYRIALRKARDNAQLAMQRKQELEEERESRRKLQSRYSYLLESNLFGLAIGAPTGEWREANDAFLNMLGYTQEEMRSGTLSWKAMTPPEYMEEDERLLKEIFENGSLRPFETELYRKDGTRCPLLIHAALLPDASGDIAIQVTDLTEQKRVQLELLSSEARFRLVVESVHDYAIYMLDKQGKVVSWNEGARRIKGFDADEVMGKHFSMFYPPEDIAEGKPQQYLDTALDKGALSDEAWHMRKDGSRFWASVLITPIYENGELQGYAKITRDLTQRRREQLLLTSIMNNVIDGIIGIDEGGSIQSFNLAAERMFGFPEKDVLGKNVHMLMPEPYHSEHDQYLRNYLGTGVAKIIGIGRQVRAQRADGSIFPIELRVSEFFVDGQRYFTGMTRDLTERRDLEEQLRQSQKMEAIGQLAGGVAHDFNNLLTIICGYSEVLDDMLPAGDSKKHFVQSIHAAGGRAAGLTRQLLAFSRQAVQEPVDLNLNTSVQETEKMLHRLIGEDIELISLLDPDVSHVLMDPGQMTQILLNLAVNARDAMPQGGKLTIETRNVELDEHYAAVHTDVTAGMYVLVSVCDTGCGMTAEVKARIFEPFFTTKEVGRGTGLGLATVYGIIKQNGGSIEVYTEPGQGTCFKVYLPTSAPRNVPAPARSETKDAARGTETVLLVEDEQQVRDFAAFSLSSYGYNVLQAEGGEAALALLSEHQGEIDLMVTDVIMPGMGGRLLAEAVQAQYPGIKVMYVSGYTDDAIVRHGILHAEVHFLTKPYTPLGLATKVRQVLDGKGA